VLRIGIGFDIHRLEEGRKLIIGGIEIPSEKGFLAHSDGDIFFHALTDAILGALCIGDIGELFPDKDERWKNADSKIFLQEAYRLMKKEKYNILNIDAVIVIEKPKLLPYREKIRENTAKILNISKNQIFLKAKTNEKLDAVGENKGASCIAVVLLKKED